MDKILDKPIANYFRTKHATDKNFWRATIHRNVMAPIVAYNVRPLKASLLNASPRT